MDRRFDIELLLISVVPRIVCQVYLDSAENGAAFVEDLQLREFGLVLVQSTIELKERLHFNLLIELSQPSR